MQREEGDTEQKKKKQKQNQKRHTKNVQRVVVAVVVVVYWLTRLNVFFCFFVVLFILSAHTLPVCCCCLFFVVAWALFNTCDRDDVSNETESRHTEIKQLASLGLVLDRQLGSAVDADDVGVCVSAGSTNSNAHTHTQKNLLSLCVRAPFLVLES